MEAKTIGLTGGRELLYDTAVGRASPAGVTELFRAHHLELVRLAVMMTGDVATAEDVVQDVYERLHRRWPAMRSAAGGLAYARASVLNGCRSAHRHAAARRRQVLRLASGQQPCGDTEAAAADRGALTAALRELPPRQREVLVLRYFCDLDVAEISQMLRIGPSSVRSAICRGLGALAAALGEDER